MKTSVRAILLAATLMVFMGFGLAAQERVSADDNEQPTTTLEIGGGGGASLSIECLWALPDMSPGDAAVTYQAPHDDSPNQPADVACDPPNNGNPGGATFGRHNMMSVLPNTHDQPIERIYQKWVAVEGSSAATAISDVYFKVWEPYEAGLGGSDGPNCTPNTGVNTPPVGATSGQWCFKYQHHATPTQGPPSASNPLTSITCADLNPLPAPGTGLYDGMFAAAVATGQMTQAEVSAIRLQCSQGSKRVFRVTETISKDQPCGEYVIQVTAINNNGVPSQSIGYFNVICFHHMEIDFSQVNWGTISANQSTQVDGNFVMEPPTSVAPTVQNQGNAVGYVRVHFNPLVLASDPTKTIVDFDVKMLASYHAATPLLIQVFDPVVASNWVCFDQHPLWHNQTGKIDFSVHPGAAQQGVYSGSVDIQMVAVCPS